MQKTPQMKGLDAQRATEQLRKFGTNELPATHSFSILRSFLSQFNNFLTILLILAGSVSFLLHEQLDGYFIAAVILLNAVLGTLQETKAEKSLASLKNMAKTTSRVLRDGTETTIESKYLVPDDVIYIDEGTKIPADAQILQAWHLEVNEAALTGESLPVLKDDKNNTIYMGTIVTSGRAYAVVTKTGAQTRFGAIAHTLTTIKEEKTPLTVMLETMSRQLGFAGIGLCIVIFLLTFTRDKNMFESFFFAVSVAVAAVPEGLPAVMTIALSIGVERMAKKGAIVRKLASIEGVGSITLLATDKTGTLTTGDMRVKKLWMGDTFYDAGDLHTNKQKLLDTFMTNGIVCSTSSLTTTANHQDMIVGDPTEGAFLIFAKKYGIDIEKIKSSWEIVDEYAFNSIKKMMTVIAKKNNETYVYSKGAPEQIITMCDSMVQSNSIIEFTDAEKKNIRNLFQEQAKNGYRVIAYSYKKHDTKKAESHHILLGFICIEDPIRPEVIDAVNRARQAEISVVMITGDNELTAARVGREVGILNANDHILTGLQLDSYSDTELLALLPQTKIFARTTPEHKLRIVSLYQKLGEIVAVTGDGVNDVLALKQAHIGVAMGKTGTDVTKETADIIITDDNFATLVNAIEEGRNIYLHIKHAIVYLLTTNSAEVFAVLFSVILGLPPILTALQILFLNLITDGPPSLALAFAPNSNSVMNGPSKNNDSILNRQDKIYIIGYGFLGGVLCIMSFIVGVNGQQPQIAQTMAFTTILFIQPYVFADLWASKRIALTHLGTYVRPAFIFAFVMPMILYFGIYTTPFMRSIFSLQTLPLSHMIIAILYAVGIWAVIEAKKLTSLFRH